MAHVLPYDSAADTLDHIRLVNRYLLQCSTELMGRAVLHDQSKLLSPEKEIFDEYTPILASLEYGSDEYKENLLQLNVALAHHYANNSHHPQHYENGIDGMNLFDVIEMYCDWVAAGKRTKDGTFEKSIEVNEKRFNMSPQLVSIFVNTAKSMNLLAQ